MSGHRVAPVDEVVCRLEAEGRELRVFHCTPERYIDLVAGWLIGEGLLDPPKAPAARFSMAWGDSGPVVYVDSIAGAWSDHDIARPEEPLTRKPTTSRCSPPSDLTEAFRELYARARRYHETGGIHAAAIAGADDLIAHAEDVGRHNAVDKVIGAAAREGHLLERCGLVTSARVSGEMARKAARSGLGWIASRSVPTTLALSIAGAAGVTIIARAAAPEARVFDPAQRPLGVVLAGGRNVRFGAPKALETVGGRRIVDRAVQALRPLCADVVMIANDAETYARVALEKRPDSRPGAGPVGGLREALLWARERRLPGIVAVACDMPFVPTSLLDALWRASEGSDGAVAQSDGPRGIEPLCAAYRTSCLDAIERTLDRGDLRVIGFFDDASIRRLTTDEVAAHGDPALVFFNVNTPAELEWARALVDAERTSEGGA